MELRPGMGVVKRGSNPRCQSLGTRAGRSAYGVPVGARRRARRRTLSGLNQSHADEATLCAGAWEKTKKDANGGC